MTNTPLQLQAPLPYDTVGNILHLGDLVAFAFGMSGELLIGRVQGLDGADGVFEAIVLCAHTTYTRETRKLLAIRA